MEMKTPPPQIKNQIGENRHLNGHLPDNRQSRECDTIKAWIEGLFMTKQLSTNYSSKYCLWIYLPFISLCLFFLDVIYSFKMYTIIYY